MKARIQRHIAAFFTIATAIVWLTACSSTKLETGGAYSPVNQWGTNAVAPMPELFATDLAYDLAYTVIDKVFAAERSNRAFLWGLSPSIKSTLDQVRGPASEANIQYLTARAVYLNNPTPAGLTALNTWLAKLKSLANSISAALPKELQL